MTAFFDSLTFSLPSVLPVNGSATGAGTGNSDSISQEEVNEQLSAGSAALGTLTDNLERLLSTASITLQPEQVAPLVGTIDLLAQAATATQREARGADAATVELRRQTGAAARNNVTDAIVRTLNVLSSPLLDGPAADEQVVLRTATFICVYQRHRLVHESRRLSEPITVAGAEDVSPLAIFVGSTNTSGVPSALEIGNETIGFALPTSLPTLRSLDVVDSTLIYFFSSLRDGGPPSTPGHLSAVVSPAMSLVLKANGSEVAVPRGGPEIFIAFPAVLSRPNETRACVADGPACDNETVALQSQVDVLQAHCSLLSRAALRPGRTRADATACLAELIALDANLTAQAARCTSLPMPCNGRGMCTDGQCICEPPWNGPQCDVQPSCKFWDEDRLSWSTEGCRTASIEMSAAQSRMVCACDHLTEFAVVANAISRPDRFFPAIQRVQFNMPVPLSLEAFGQSVQKITPLECSIFLGIILVLAYGLNIATACDDRATYITRPSRWRLWIADFALSTGRRGCAGKIIWVMAVILLFVFESQHLLCVLLVNRAAAVYGYAEMTMVAYQLTLGEIAVVILFWGTEDANESDQYTQLWAAAIAAAMRACMAVLSVTAFSFALLTDANQTIRGTVLEDLEAEADRALKPAWMGTVPGRVIMGFLGSLPGVGPPLANMLEWCFEADGGNPGWLLVLRQTAPATDGKAGAKSRGQKPNEQRQPRVPLQLRASPECGWWQTLADALLLSASEADQFCSDLLRRVPPRCTFAADGSVHFKLTCYRRRRGLLRWMLSDLQVCKLIWKQSAAEELLGCRTGSETHRGEALDFELLRHSGLSGLGIDERMLRGLQRCRRGAQGNEAPGLLALGVDEEGEPLLVVGQRDASISGLPTLFDRVELFMYAPGGKMAMPDEAVEQDEKETYLHHPPRSLPPPPPPSVPPPADEVWDGRMWPPSIPPPADPRPPVQPSAPPTSSRPANADDPSSPREYGANYPSSPPECGALETAGVQNSRSSGVSWTRGDSSASRSSSSSAEGNNPYPRTSARTQKVVAKASKAPAKVVKVTAKATAKAAGKATKAAAKCMAEGATKKRDEMNIFDQRVVVGDATTAFKEAIDRWERHDFVTLGPIPRDCIVRQSDGTVGFFFSLEKVKPDDKRLDALSHRSGGSRDELLDMVMLKSRQSKHGVSVPGINFDVSATSCASAQAGMDSAAIEPWEDGSGILLDFPARLSSTRSEAAFAATDGLVEPALTSAAMEAEQEANTIGTGTQAAGSNRVLEAPGADRPGMSWLSEKLPPDAPPSPPAIPETAKPGVSYLRASTAKRVKFQVRARVDEHDEAPEKWHEGSRALQAAQAAVRAAERAAEFRRSMPLRYVPIELLERKRKWCRHVRTEKVAVTYSRQEACGIEVDALEVVEPAEAHRILGRWYECQLLEKGTPHADVMEAMEDAFFVPPLWRDALRPYSGAFAGGKLINAWRFNYLVLALLIALLVMDYLTLKNTLSSGSVGETLLLGLVVEPTVEALWVLLEVLYILVGLALVQKLLEMTGVVSKAKIKRARQALEVRRASLPKRFSAASAATRTSTHARLSMRSASVQRTSMARPASQRASVRPSTRRASQLHALGLADELRT